MRGLWNAHEGKLQAQDGTCLRGSLCMFRQQNVNGGTSGALLST